MSQIIFPSTGKEYTEQTYRAAVAEARARGIKYLIFASTGGYVAEKVLEIGVPEDIKTIMVTHAYGSREANTNRMPEELRQRCKDAGIIVVTAGHALSGVERSLSGMFKGVYPVEIIAHTLRMFGAGTKVAVEIAAMAADAGEIPVGEPVMCVGGTGTGADTALILKAAYSAKLLETKIEEYVCKPTV